MQFFEKLFGSRKPKKGYANPHFSDVSIQPELLPLEMAVFSAAMEASKAIKEGWAERTGQNEMPFVSSWAIRVEELGFFLHLVCRLSFTVGGNTMREVLQDYLTMRLINALVDSSFDTSNVKPGVNTEELSSKMKLETLDVINDSEIEYAQCRTMLKLPFEIQPGDVTAPVEFLAPDDSDITGCLAKRIAEDTGQTDTPKLRELIWGTTVHATYSLQIVRQVEAAIKAISA